MKENLTILRESLKNLLADNKLKDTIETLKCFLKSSPSLKKDFNSLILFKSRFSVNEENYNKGILHYEDYMIERNRIVKELISIIDNLGVKENLNQKNEFLRYFIIGNKLSVLSLKKEMKLDVSGIKEELVNKYISNKLISNYLDLDLIKIESQIDDFAKKYFKYYRFNFLLGWYLEYYKFLLVKSKVSNSEIYRIADKINNFINLNKLKNSISKDWIRIFTKFVNQEFDLEMYISQLNYFTEDIVKHINPTN